MICVLRIFPLSKTTTRQSDSVDDCELIGGELIGVLEHKNWKRIALDFRHAVFVFWEMLHCVNESKVKDVKECLVIYITS